MLKEILKSLSKEERECLMIAFNGGFSHLVLLSNGHFIGVHTINNPKYIIEETQGAWVYGRVN